MSGLSSAQYGVNSSGSGGSIGGDDDDILVYGDINNKLNDTNPVYNIGEEILKTAINYYNTLPSDHAYLISNDE